ncbi:uridine diphosphate-N-acetylglucosamine-binding protein YvcK [Corynebacterium sp. zg-331]|uniref:gluconeogenesis factor YvcK family protein n=1 Tax=unclassified Corynebacterium TaxID=2624378 RepID=UPI0013FF5DB3|nr:uridine diphosphate-N-acetylglucosamine-binding protein YvcK [Corynebacterium sp. zg-331]MPV51994.1 uridine diphosphate-N-acetylglucosamine-binding protein YvcK [Corynebacterium sp. zg331]
MRHIVSLGGGHGLFQTLRADRLCTPETITAIVTVADDGGSSGRIRRELRTIPPGDLRMALAALAGDDPSDQMWASALQHRFGGHGALAGHAVGNLLISGLEEVLGSTQQALDTVARLTGSRGRVVPMCLQPLDIEADVSGLDDDPRIMRPVRGQVAVASTPGSVRRVRLLPENPEANPTAQEAIIRADVVTLGPGSWFSSVIPHLLVPGIVEALNATSAQKIVVLNLSAEPGETQGFSSERHLHMLSQHAPALRVDRILIEASSIPTTGERAHVERAAARLGAIVEFADVEAVTVGGERTNRHDPAKLAAALRGLAAAD